MDATTPGVTFLFTDIEGSTRLWETEPARMADALARHDRLCRVAVENHGGRLVKMLGDGLHAVFSDPAAAVASVLELQRGMADIAKDCGIPFKMRCGLNAGEPELRDGDFFGSAVNRAARIAGAAHGGQILLSQAFVDLGKGRFPEGTDLMYLGRVRLRDRSSSEDIWQLLHAELPRTFAALRSLDSTPNNLPQELTSFIGRQKEITEIRKLLGRTRLLTVIGSGGCGKTRLALQVAADLLESYPDGVWLVELAALVDAGLVAQAVATVLRLKEEPNRTLTETLAEHLKSRHLLLLLDNAEHVLGTCADLADLLLRQCPNVLMLVTSRERLGIGGELTYRVPSLSIPDPKQDATPEHLSQYESVRLFIERAQFQLPRFAVTQQNAPALASVCYRLDGIPLALELAAARMRSMSVEEVDRRLDHRFGLLKGGSRTAPPRQQTLRSLIDWSYDFLNAAEKSLLSRLAVLYGDWVLETAERICSGEGVEEGQVFDLLTSLVDKSLVGAEQRKGATRYRQLETVRQYGQERLRECGEETYWQGRHLAYFLRLAEEAAVGMKGAEQQVWLDRLETVHDNLRAALTHSSAPGGDAASGLELAGALARFWEVRGYVGEGRGWLAALLAVTPSGQATEARGRALNAAGILARAQGDYSAARAYQEESLAIRRELGDRAGIAGALNNLGLAAYDRGDYPAAQALLEDSLAIMHELGDQRGAALVLTNLGNVVYEQHKFGAAQAQLEQSLTIFREVENQWGIALALTNLGDVVCGRGDYPAARRLLEESLAISRQLGDRERIAHSLNILGKVTCEQGDYLVAWALHREGLAIMRELGDRWGMAWTLEGLAVAFARALPSGAARIWGQAERLREEIGAPLPPSEQPRYNRYVAVARAAIGDSAFDSAWQEGRAMTLEHALGYALKGRDA